jgi:hypothetical protein
MMVFGQGPGDDHQIRHEDASANPALKAIGCMSRATPELDGALHHTDATLDAVAEAQTFLEPTLFFGGCTLWRALASVWEGDLLDAQAASQALIVRGEESAVTRQPVRRMTEALAMLSQQSRQHLDIRRIASGDNLPIADQAVFDFGVVDLVPELGFMRLRFALPDDLRVRLP